MLQLSLQQEVELEEAQLLQEPQEVLEEDQEKIMVKVLVLVQEMLAVILHLKEIQVLEALMFQEEAAVELVLLELHQVLLVLEEMVVLVQILGLDRKSVV